MSFKRDGDDSSLLNNLKRRRVSELLALHIPEDEALLLKNGRYTCIVCKHRPIFDTLDILAIHRKGKKHLENLSGFLAKQQEVKDIILKRRHDQYLRTGNSNIKLPAFVPTVCASNSFKSSPLQKEASYSSCRKKAKITDRKLAISLEPKTSSKKDVNIVDVSPSLTVQNTPRAVVQTYLKSMQRKGSFEKIVEQSRRLSKLPSKTVPDEHPKCDQMSLSSSSDSSAPPFPSITLEQQRKANAFLNLCRDGWKRTSEGQWVKDEQAEFDSDEETPPFFLE